MNSAAKKNSFTHDFNCIIFREKKMFLKSIDIFGRKIKSIYIKMIIFRCKICDSEILFSLEAIKNHVKKSHRLTLTAYKVWA